MKECASDISFGDIVTIWVDPWVASHARWVVAIVVYLKESGGILACADGGCNINGKTTREWWIASDGYELKARKTEPVTLSSTLAEVQRQVIECVFSWARHQKCSLGSPCCDQTATVEVVDAQWGVVAIATVVRVAVHVHVVAKLSKCYNSRYSYISNDIDLFHHGILRW